jgi:hypothetical protein
MNIVIATARKLQDFCDRQGWRFCFIGGVAVQRWAEPRATRDVDITLLTGFGHEDQFINALAAEYTPRIADPANFAKRNRVLLLQSADGVGIDISMGAMPFELSAVERASYYSFEPGCDLRICSAEDLLVFKIFASRPLDLRDAEGVVVRHYKTLDWRYIEEQLTPLAELKEEPELLSTLARLKKLRP